MVISNLFTTVSLAKGSANHKHEPSQLPFSWPYGELFVLPKNANAGFS